MRGLLITFSGVDCAGKTTQIALLEEAMRARSFETIVFWYRPGYSKELDALRAAARRLRPGALPRSDRDGAREATFRRPLVRRVWTAMALSDMTYQYAVKVRALLARGKTVICDRYLCDAEIDLELRFPELRAQTVRWMALLRRVCPAPAHAFLLMLPRDEMLRRADRKREPYPDPPGIRDQRYIRYGAVAERGGQVVIDASRTIDEVHADILRGLNIARVEQWSPCESRR